jgi:hypothetical protein
MLTGAVIVEGVVVAVAVVFVLALLRSHAEILRRLEALEPAVREPGGRPAAGRPGDIAGQTLAGDAVKLSLGAGSPRTLLAFLSSGCAACEPLWAAAGDPSALPPARVVVVTKDPDRERLGRLLELAPAGAEVVMSSAAWASYAVPATPHFVLVDGVQGIVGRGSATSWHQIGALVMDAGDDSRVHRGRARSTDERAARAEAALAGAGIGPGHPSLHPAHGDPRQRG